MKKFSFAAILCFILSAGYSQTFLHGAGVSLNVSTVSGVDPSVYSGFHYNPRINFLETESLALSVGVPLTIGGSFSYNYSDNIGSSSSFQYLIQAPVIINANFGRGSTKENENKMGFFFGGGWAFNQSQYIASTQDQFGNDYDYNENEFNMGPAANAGIRIGVGRSHKNIEIRLSYVKAITGDAKPNMFGLTTAFNF